MTVKVCSRKKCIYTFCEAWLLRGLLTILLNEFHLFLHASFLVHVQKVKPRYMSLYMCANPTDAQPRVNPDVDYGLWGIIMCQGRFNCKGTTLVGNIDNGEATHVWGQGVCETFLYLLKFAVNLKVLKILRLWVKWCYLYLSHQMFQIEDQFLQQDHEYYCEFY